MEGFADAVGLVRFNSVVWSDLIAGPQLGGFAGLVFSVFSAAGEALDFGLLTDETGSAVGPALVESPDSVQSGDLGSSASAPGRSLRVVYSMVVLLFMYSAMSLSRLNIR